ncbi:60S ribosomal protein L21 [Plasmodiophora brassicae]|uniref:60S ribosomal protein L21 n=1 Tax=Plasmodiophora brassicae TaxID=37360 RepID=A0A0G4IWR7_PLABS|nr:hypothetical protein PBRA_007502 [Plasmodiophora brassicae]SPQ97070.1 unnamed protein product [Plasmodiophora brassicae]
MPHSFGYRARTRHMFARDFRKHGRLNQTTYLRSIKIGDYVDVVGNGSIQKGMPHKFYHGKTGKVWNITPRAIGVIINKPIGNRIMAKKIHVRIEHCRPSRCQEDFKKRVRENQAVRVANKSRPKDQQLPLPAVRQPESGIPAHTVKTSQTTVELLQPQAHISFYV